MHRDLDALLSALAGGPPAPVYLIAGDLVLTVPAAERMARALAERAGCEVEIHRHPAKLAPLLDDLRTFSLFSAAKVMVAVDTALLADRKAAAGLIDDAEAALPISAAGGEPSPRERRGASRLLQALRLFGIDPDLGSQAEALSGLPEWALAGGAAFRKRRGGRGRTKRQVEELRQGLGELLTAAREAGLAGWAEGDLAELAAVIDGGLPPGHSLVLAERSVASDHPLVAGLAARGLLVEMGEVEASRGGGWQGLDLLADELVRQTGVAITPDALAELARRTLRQGSDWRQGKGVDGDSSGRFAAEYRKLATLVGGGVAEGEEAGGEGGGQPAAAGPVVRIERQLVADVVADRGEEDVWQLLDAVGAGRGGEALGRLGRLLGSASDPVAARLSFFSLLAGFCRQLVAVRSLMELKRVPPGERSYPRFKARLAQTLQGELPAGGVNPIAGLHPFRLHRAYLAAGRFSPAALATLPWRVLETELQLKGESGDPDTALAHLVAHLSS